MFPKAGLLVPLLLALCSLGEGQDSTTPEDTTTTTPRLPALPPPTICPSDWIDAADLGCFKFLDSAVNLFWVEAQQKCQSIGGYLAEPTTTRKGEFLHGIANIYQTITNIDHWWIGLSDQGKEGHWIWSSSGSDLTDTFWNANHPNTNYGNTDDCGVMVVQPDTFWWEDSGCLTTVVQQSKVAPICQRERLHAACPDGALFEGRLYCMNLISTLTWQEAEDDCTSKRGHLASIHSKAEGDFIIELAGSSTNYIWLGASDAVKEGTWVWTDGSAWDYTNWYSGQPPNDGTSSNCLVFNVVSNARDQWYDYPCSYARNYVCKI